MNRKDIYESDQRNVHRELKTEFGVDTGIVPAEFRETLIEIMERAYITSRPGNMLNSLLRKKLVMKSENKGLLIYYIPKET
jgi:hypothetical protein